MDYNIDMTRLALAGQKWKCGTGFCKGFSPSWEAQAGVFFLTCEKIITALAWQDKKESVAPASSKAPVQTLKPKQESFSSPVKKIITALALAGQKKKCCTGFCKGCSPSWEAQAGVFFLTCEKIITALALAGQKRKCCTGFFKSSSPNFEAQTGVFFSFVKMLHGVICCMCDTHALFHCLA